MSRANGIGPRSSSRNASLRPVAAIDPFEVLLRYERDSLAHSVGLPEEAEAPGAWRGIGYRLGARLLVSSFEDVIEILPVPGITPVPGALGWMLGISSVRGELLPIIDLRHFLEGVPCVRHEGMRMLIVNQPGGQVALLVEELFGQRSFVAEQDIGLAAARPEGRFGRFIDTVYRVEDEMWNVFSLERLARTPEFRQAAAEPAIGQERSAA